MNSVTACLIIKDEEDFLPLCLEALVPVVDEIVIVDTGSVDSSVEIALKYGARISRKVWDNDFSSARNYAKEQAKCDWILYIDADEKINSQGKPLSSHLDSKNFDAYELRIHNLLTQDNHYPEIVSHNSLRLFKNSNAYKFEGRIHEQILPSLLKNNARIALSDLEIYHYGYLKEIREKKKKFERNVALLKMEAESFPDDGFVWFNLAMEYYVVEEYSSAAQYYETALQMCNPNAVYYPRLVRNLAYCYFSQRQLKKAETICAEGLRKYPNYTDLWYISGQVYKELGFNEKAIFHLTKALKLGDAQSYEGNIGLGSYKALLSLGDLYMEMGDIANGIKSFERGILAYPHYLPFFLRLGRYYLLHKQFEKAVSLFAHGRSIHPELLPLHEKAELIYKKTQDIKYGG